MTQATNVKMISNQIIVTRILAAPIELVWRNWSQIDRLEKWWGPDNFSIKTKKFAFENGGAWQFDMISEEFGSFPNAIIYQEIIPFHKIKYANSNDLAETKPDRPIRFDVIVDFLSTNERETLLTMTTTFPTEADLKWVVATHHADEGAIQHMEGLAALVENEAADMVVVSRHFDHDCEIVFNAFIDPKMAGQFLFRTQAGILKTCEIDARIGGKFEIVEVRDGIEAAHFGQYLMLEKPNKIMFSFGDELAFGKTIVAIEITKTETGCHLVLFHRGVLPEYLLQTNKGWGSILENCARTVA